MGAELRDHRRPPPGLARVQADVQRTVDAGEVRLSESSPSATRFRRAGRGRVEVITFKPLSKNPGALQLESGAGERTRTADLLITKHWQMPIRRDQTALLQTNPDHTASVQDATFGIGRTFSHTASAVFGKRTKPGVEAFLATLCANAVANPAGSLTTSPCLLPSLTIGLAELRFDGGRFGSPDPKQERVRRTVNVRRRRRVVWTCL